MRAVLRYVLAPLVIVAAVGAGGASAFAATAAAHPNACPAGSHWDNITHSCVPD